MMRIFHPSYLQLEGSVRFFEGSDKSLKEF